MEIQTGARLATAVFGTAAAAGLIGVAAGRDPDKDDRVALTILGTAGIMGGILLAGRAGGGVGIAGPIVTAAAGMGALALGRTFGTRSGASSDSLGGSDLLDRSGVGQPLLDGARRVRDHLSTPVNSSELDGSFVR